MPTGGSFYRMDALLLNRELFIVSVVKALWQNPARTLFALSAISLGIASLVFIVAAIQGSNRQAQSIIQLLGPNSIFVRSGFGDKSSVRRLTYRIDLKDLENLKHIYGIRAASYLLLKQKRISVESEARNAYAVAAARNFLDVFDYRPYKGRFFYPREYSSFPKICIIGTELAKYFFGSSNPLGRKIKVSRTTFTIVGVFAPKGKLPSGKSLDDRLIIPIKSYRKFVEPEYRRIFAIKLKLEPYADYDHVVSMVKQVMAKRHSKDDFVVITPETVRKFLNIFNWTLSLYLGLASLVALFISGFVMSNIFFINVKVRAWEIGIKRAIGATRQAIIWQFVAEALTVSIAGAAAGSIIGFMSIKWITPMLGIPTVYPMKSLVLAIAFSSVTGLLSVLMPARAASRLNMVSALKSRL